jgi:hypothetical protein
MWVLLLQVVVASTLLLALLLGWIEVQRAARRVAEAHPEAGPLRLIGGGCGGHGHGDSAKPAGPARLIAIAPAARPAAAPAAGSCASCDNTACKSPDKALPANR